MLTKRLICLGSVGSIVSCREHVVFASMHILLFVQFSSQRYFSSQDNAVCKTMSAVCEVVYAHTDTVTVEVADTVEVEVEDEEEQIAPATPSTTASTSVAPSTPVSSPWKMRKIAAESPGGNVSIEKSFDDRSSSQEDGFTIFCGAGEAELFGRNMEKTFECEIVEDAGDESLEGCLFRWEKTGSVLRAVGLGRK